MKPHPRPVLPAILSATLFALLLTPFSGAAGQAEAVATKDSLDSRPAIWYRQPATNWDEALPIGNGRLGAMVLGGIARERLQLNEENLWAGCPVDAYPALHDGLMSTKRLFDASQAPAAKQKAEKKDFTP